MGIRKRILEYLEYKGISKYRFYHDIGVSNGFLDKEGNIGSDKCEKIYYQYPDVNLEWLITGKGDMLTSKITVQGNKNIVGNTNAGHVVSIEESSNVEKIIKDKEIEIVYQTAASQEAQRTVKDLLSKIESLEQIIKIKDEYIHSLNKTIESKEEIISMKDDYISMLTHK